MRVKESLTDRIFNIINLTFLTLIVIITAYPLIFVCIASISNPDLINTGKIFLIPKDISFDGYTTIFKDPSVLKAYANTIFYTVTGTTLNLAVTLPAAYALSRPDFIGKNVFTFIFTVTMFFSGGLIPTYLLVSGLKMNNTIWVMIILGATNMTNMIICRTFFKSNVPMELQESAQIDGCSNFRIFFSIVLPLSASIIAVMALYFGIAHWNSYFNAMIYLRNKNLFPLQLILREILVKSEFDAQMLLTGANEGSQLNLQLRIAEQVKYALIVVASIPVLLIYPLIQKHFVKGVLIGSIKG